MKESREGNKGTEECKNRGKQSFLTRRGRKEMAIRWKNKTGGKTIKEKGRREINMRRG
jgi:hypothetical protein